MSEDKFPCSNPNWDNEVDLGRFIAQDLRLGVFMIARDCATRLSDNIPRIHELGQCFKSYQVFSFENDSKDKTPELLKEAGFHVRSIQMQRMKWPSVRSRNRAQEMAQYRELCKDQGVNDDHDVTIVFDPDLPWFSIKGVMHTMHRWGQFDWVASNGVKRFAQRTWHQADAWAFRMNDWKPKPYGTICHHIFHRGNPFVQVLSAFGGLCVYRRPVYFAARYGGDDCEHVTLHRRLHKAGFTRGYVNPSQIAVYKW